jgi:hypothetical protein
VRVHCRQFVPKIPTHLVHCSLLYFATLRILASSEGSACVIAAVKVSLQVATPVEALKCWAECLHAVCGMCSRHHYTGNLPPLISKTPHASTTFSFSRRRQFSAMAAAWCAQKILRKLRNGACSLLILALVRCRDARFLFSQPSCLLSQDSLPAKTSVLACAVLSHALLRSPRSLRAVLSRLDPLSPICWCTLCRLHSHSYICLDRCCCCCFLDQPLALVTLSSLPA